MKKLLAFTLAILAHVSFAQTDFRKGYVVTNEKDTLFGMIDYREGFKAYRSCDYKSSVDGSTANYQPGTIIGYGFDNNKFFESREVRINDSEPKIVFVEVIVRGKVSLFRFEDIFFLEKDASGLLQLSNETKEVYVDDRRSLINTNKHIGIMNSLMSDCPELSRRIAKMDIVEKHLTMLVEDYNACNGKSSVVYKEDKPWTKVGAGIIGGINISQLEFQTILSGMEYLTGSFKESKSPVVGASLNLSSPRISERFSFQFDFLYLNSNYYSYTQFGSPVKRNYVTIELQQIKIPIGIRYTFPERGFTPYLHAGFSGTIHLTSDSKWVKEVASGKVVNTYEDKAVVIKKNQLGYWVGLGVNKSVSKRLNAFVELRYEATDGVCDYLERQPADLTSSVANIQIFFGIRIK